DHEGNIFLTESGQEIAEIIYERHKILTELFEKLGVSHETALDDACKVEHDISEETFECIREYYKSQKKI
ncbi:MAG: iron dependent repressor, metal binding and dimerization domain protein, partial [Eubacteriales bacterium]|nr:iron dependent repressor, metal binding and dimerization domain protein [Eubacteriales bacterium]